MQTFLPYPSFSESARVLDYRRLGKQRVECKQLLSALGHEVHHGQLRLIMGERKAGWSNHPASKMWRGYEQALAVYQTSMIYEWIKRGYNNTMEFLSDDVGNAPRNAPSPPWLGNEAFHASHRSNLLRKDPVFYGKHGWAEENDLEYIWPTV